MPITVVLDNIRSAYNVGAIMRTLDAVGGGEIICCGITPYPELPGDDRSPVVRSANTRSIVKTALGAQEALTVTHERSALAAIDRLRAARAVTVLAVERSDASVDLFEFESPAEKPLALVFGSEVGGIDPDTLAACDAVLEIPQFGVKNSLNVSVAAGIALYALGARVIYDPGR
ncbi:MAG: TrmH family RNA methyltransferase [Solirubrobacterales bacterium]